MLDHGNAQLSSVGAFLPSLGGAESSPAFFGGGVGGGSMEMPRGFDLEIGKGGQSGKVINCAIVFGRQLVECDDVTLSGLGENDTPAGVIYAKISHASGESLALTVEKGGELPDNTLETTYRLLYKAAGEGADAHWVDYRYVPVVFSLN